MCFNPTQPFFSPFSPPFLEGGGGGGGHSMISHFRSGLMSFEIFQNWDQQPNDSYVSRAPTLIANETLF